VFLELGYVAGRVRAGRGPLRRDGQQFSEGAGDYLAAINDLCLRSTRAALTAQLVALEFRAATWGAAGLRSAALADGRAWQVTERPRDSELQSVGWVAAFPVGRRREEESRKLSMARKGNVPACSRGSSSRFPFEYCREAGPLMEFYVGKQTVDCWAGAQRKALEAGRCESPRVSMRGWASRGVCRFWIHTKKKPAPLGRGGKLNTSGDPWNGARPNSVEPYLEVPRITKKGRVFFCSFFFFADCGRSPASSSRADRVEARGHQNWGPITEGLLGPRACESETD